MTKTCTKTFVKRGKEIQKENLKANGIYAVRYSLPVERAAELGTVQEQWGIVVLDAEKNIKLTWNVGDFNQVSPWYPNGKPWTENMTFFRSSIMERQLIEYYCLWVSENKRFGDKIEAVERRFEIFRADTLNTLHHPLHRLADQLIRILDFFKV